MDCLAGGRVKASFPNRPNCDHRVAGKFYDDAAKCRDEINEFAEEAIKQTRQSFHALLTPAGQTLDERCEANYVNEEDCGGEAS
jgi:hypothetical protein